MCVETTLTPVLLLSTLLVITGGVTPLEEGERLGILTLDITVVVGVIVKVEVTTTSELAVEAGAIESPCTAAILDLYVHFLSTALLNLRLGCHERAPHPTRVRSESAVCSCYIKGSL